MNAILGQLPVNNQSKKSDDPFLKAGFELLSNAYGLAQFYDRDALPTWPRLAWKASRNSW